MSDLKLYFLLLFGLLLLCSSVLLFFRYFYKRELRIKNLSTACVEGIVVGYKYSKPAGPPIVEYKVDGRTYQRNLDYHRVTLISVPWKSVQATSRSELLAQKIQEELEKIDKDLLSQEVDVGGTAIKEGNRYKHISGQTRYDFEANLRMADLQQNGLRGYYLRQILKENPNDIAKAVNDLKILEEKLNAIEPSGDYTKEVKSLFSGDGTIPPKQLGGEKLVKGLREFQNITRKNEDFKFNYDAYSKNEDLYFNQLVGVE